jgi:hypothetical protein
MDLARSSQVERMHVLLFGFLHACGLVLFGWSYEFKSYNKNVSKINIKV